MNELALQSNAAARVSLFCGTDILSMYAWGEAGFASYYTCKSKYSEQVYLDLLRVMVSCAEE